MGYVQLLAGFIIIIKGADYLVVSASKLARSFGISTLVIGLSLIAFGTSAPELTIGVISGIERANGVTRGSGPLCPNCSQVPLPPFVRKATSQ